MFDNIGGKIKNCATVCCVIGIICSVLAGACLLITGTAGGTLAGILIAAIGGLLSWLSSLGLYGFGQLVENSDTLVKRSQWSAARPAVQSVAQPNVHDTGRIVDGKIIFPMRKQDMVKCPKCGAGQVGYREQCCSCNEPFFYESEMK